MARSARYVQKILTYSGAEKIFAEKFTKTPGNKFKCFYTVSICKVRVEIFANKYHSF